MPPIDPDNPEWTNDDFRRAHPAIELPGGALAAFPWKRGRQVAPRKVRTAIRLSQDVLDYFKATGPGWQSRIDEALKKAAGL